MRFEVFMPVLGKTMVICSFICGSIIPEDPRQQVPQNYWLHSVITQKAKILVKNGLFICNDC